MKGIHFVGLGIVGLIMTLFIGWVLNIIALIGSLGGPLDALFVARVAGIFAAPLGGVLGYF